MFPPTSQLLPVLYNNQDDRPSEYLSAIITFGPHMDASDDFRLRTNLQNKVAIPPYLRVLTVISDSLSWTKERNDLIRDWLPSSVKNYNIIIIDPSRHSKARMRTWYDKGILASVVSYIAIPIDEVDEELANAIIHFPCLKELTIRNRNRPSFLERNVTFLLKMLKSFNTLEVVCFSLCDGEDVEDILITLQNHPNLTRLALLISPSFHFRVLRGPPKVAFENSIIRGLESFTQLERIILTDSLMNDLLLLSLRRLPRLNDLRVMADSVVTEDKMFDYLRGYTSARRAFRT